MRSRARILIIDDDEYILEFVGAALADEGYETELARDGAEALALIQQKPPDLILLDIWMPVMDGRQFMRAYSEMPGPHAPVVVMTASRDARAIMVEIKAADYLGKPFGLDTLLDLVASHTGGAEPAGAGGRSS